MPASSPVPRLLSMDVRLALSKEPLKEYVQLWVLLLERCQCIGDGAASIEAFK